MKFLTGILVFFFFYSQICFADWAEQIKKSANLLSNDQLNLLEQQYRAYTDGTLIKGSDPECQNIPIQENADVLIDILKQKNNRIKTRSTPKKNSKKVSVPENIKMRKQLFIKLEQLIIELDNLAFDFGFEKAQINIVVTSAFRDINTQTRLFNDKSAQICKQTPELTKLECDTEASYWVAPIIANTPPHPTGGAVDMKLYDNKNKKFLDLGIIGTHVDNPTAPTFSAQITEDQIKNRLYLLMAAIKAGLVNYPFEFWHYSYGDRYAAYWLNLPYAVYDIVNITPVKKQKQPVKKL